MEVDITAPVLDFSNGTRNQLVFVGEGATFNTKNAALLNLPTDLVNGMGGLSANVATIDANTVGTNVVNYSGVDAAGNALKDSASNVPAVLTYNVVAIANPVNVSATYDGSSVLLSWDKITNTNTSAAFNRYEVLTDGANPINVSGNAVKNFAAIPNVNMGASVTYKIRAVVDGSIGEAAGTGSSVTITPIALSDDHKRGKVRTNINNFGGSQVNLTNTQRRRIFKNLFDENPLARSEKRVLVDKASLKFLANKVNYARIKDDVVVLPPEVTGDTEVLTINRIDLSNKTLYSALELNDVLKVKFAGKPNIFKFTQTAAAVLKVQEYADATALANDSPTTSIYKADGQIFNIPQMNVILTAGSVVITAGDIPCLTKGTMVKTPTGFVKVETLRVGDMVQVHDGRAVPIMNMIRNNIVTTETNTPYIIPKNFFGANMPKNPFTISPNHAVCADALGNEWFIPAHHGGDLERVAVGVRESYFHVELPNWLIDNMVIEKNIVVESHAEAYHKNLELANPLYDELKNGLYKRAYKAYAHQERVIKLAAKARAGNRTTL